MLTLGPERLGPVLAAARSCGEGRRLCWGARGHCVPRRCDLFRGGSTENGQPLSSVGSRAPAEALGGSRTCRPPGAARAAPPSCTHELQTRCFPEPSVRCADLTGISRWN